ncbi:uncharacterized protein LOC132718178 [Ruditapes philippinarum]|uniref:uncharacterized protein LOC132718178 n=1 Tax=Ruditapes philippinarum TaxID=129788 RepID=UPI00295BF22D|nr:uncharacterized protein LOC132718178 [Ruditapes philippinarum]
MHAFYVMEMDISEKLDHVGESILQKLEQFDDTRELIRRMLGESSRINTVPGVKIFLDLKNVSDDEEAKMSDVLQQLFEEVIHEDNDFKSSIPAESYVRLRGAIKKTFERFLSKGWKITGVIHECIQLHIECTNFTALAALIREQTHGLIEPQLTDLNEALTECIHEEMLCLETTIYKDEFWNVIDKSISCVEDVLKEHNIDMANQSDNAQLLGDDIRKHSLSLSAEKVGSDGSGSFEGDCNNKLETFLQLLKAELKSEFHTPNLLIQANFSTNVNHESNDSSIGNKVELPEENTQTIRSDHQSPKFDKKEKEIIKTFKDEDGEYVERVFKELSLKDIEQQQMGTLVKQEEHSSKEKIEIAGQVRKDISTAISSASTATDLKEVETEKIEITSQIRKDIPTAISSASTATDLKEVETEGDLHKNTLHAILNSLNAILVYCELASLTLIESDRSFLDKLYVKMEEVRSLVGAMFWTIEDFAYYMEDSLHNLALPRLVKKEWGREGGGN